MLRISRLTDYATVILATLAAEPGRVQTSACLAEQTKLALPTVSKVLKQLQRAGLVASTRGLRGGYQLARAATEISAGDILDALEGPVALTDCASGHGNCGFEKSCRRKRIEPATAANNRLADHRAHGISIEVREMRSRGGGTTPPVRIFRNPRQRNRR